MLATLLFGHARIQGIGINLRPRSEKNHNFHKNASILINKVTFFSWNICPHDKIKLKVIQDKYLWRLEIGLLIPWDSKLG